MGAPTVSRLTLRRALARRFNMPFAQRIGTHSALTGSPTTTRLFDSARLVQRRANTWNQQYVYLVDGNAAGQMRVIADFIPEETMLVLDEPLSAAPAAGNLYEIHSKWGAATLHDAINHAIDQAFPAFFSVAVDETIPVQRDTIEYALPADCYRVLRLWVGQQSVLARGTATGGGGTTLTDSAAAFPDLAGQRVSIVWSAGKGQIRTIQSNTATELTVSAAWDTPPAAGSMYVVFEVVRAPFDWLRFAAARFDRSEFPTRMYLPMTLAAWEGLPFRLEYVQKPRGLGADADETVVPAEYLLPKAMAYCHSVRLEAGAMVDQQRHLDAMVKWETVAESYKLREGWRHPPSTVWRGQEAGDLYSAYPLDYPLG